jgi:hypothetical protein
MPPRRRRDLPDEQTREQRRRWSRERRERLYGTEPPVHGREGYSIYRCRCDICGAAQAAYIKRYATDRDALLSNPRRYAEWTGPELETVMRDDLSLYEIAELVGRSYSSVVRARSQLRHGDARMRRLAGLPPMPEDRA